MMLLSVAGGEQMGGRPVVLELVISDSSKSRVKGYELKG